jgi:hypothetical protein
MCRPFQNLAVLEQIRQHRPHGSLAPKVAFLACKKRLISVVISPMNKARLGEMLCASCRASWTCPRRSFFSRKLVYFCYLDESGTPQCYRRITGYVAKKLETLCFEETSAARVLREMVKNQRLG